MEGTVPGGGWKACSGQDDQAKYGERDNDYNDRHNRQLLGSGWSAVFRALGSGLSSSWGNCRSTRRQHLRQIYGTGKDHRRESGEVRATAGFFSARQVITELPRSNKPRCATDSFKSREVA